MVHHRRGDGFHIVEARRWPTIDQGVSSRGFGHGNGRARRGAIRHVRIHIVDRLGRRPDAWRPPGARCIGRPACGR